MAFAVCTACLGAARESTTEALETAGEIGSCEAYAAAVTEGQVEADVAGVQDGGELWEWSETVALWSSVQAPGDSDSWTFALRDVPGLALDPWVRLHQSDMVGHAWLEVCARYEGAGSAACYVGSTPTADGCCDMVDEYGVADVHLALDDAWSDDGGTLHVTVRSPDDTCGSYWLLVAGDRPDDA